MLYGKARITGVDANGRNFVDDVGVGDLWYFPSGIPHSIQGLEPDGAEFLLVFDNGDFDEDNTFLLSDWITFRRKSWPRTSACRPQPLRMSPIRAAAELAGSVSEYAGELGTGQPVTSAPEFRRQHSATRFGRRNASGFSSRFAPSATLTAVFTSI